MLLLPVGVFSSVAAISTFVLSEKKKKLCYETRIEMEEPAGGGREKLELGDGGETAGHTMRTDFSRRRKPIKCGGGCRRKREESKRGAIISPKVLLPVASPYNLFLK